MRIRSGDVVLQSFEAALSDVVLQVRNHPSVRSQMRNTALIAAGEHALWVQENLIATRKSHLFVITANEQPVGIALLRNFQGGCAEIGVMVVEPGLRPLVCYKAAHLIGYYAFEIIDLKQVISYVPRHNQRALDFNLHCGLVPAGDGTKIYHELILTRESSRTHPTHKHFRAKYGIEVSE